jgi:hypothetical protein
MYDKPTAESINESVRSFFKGDEISPGFKSDNKKYAADPIEGVTLKEGQATKRNTNQLLSTPVRGVIQTFPGKLKQKGLGATPTNMGKVIVMTQQRAGNCAEMCWVSCHMATEKGVNIWIAIIDDPGDHQFCVLSEKKPTFTSIKDMKYMGEDQWIIDPWANIVCKPGEFFGEFTLKMKKWTERGKRVGVVVSNKYVWTAGGDPVYLKNNLTSALIWRNA